MKNIVIVPIKDESRSTLEDFIRRIPSGVSIVPIINGTRTLMNETAESLFIASGIKPVTHYEPINDQNPLRFLRYMALRMAEVEHDSVVGFLDADCHYDSDISEAFESVRSTGKIGILDNNYLTTEAANSKLKKREQELWDSFKSAGSKYWFCKLRAVQILCPAKYITEEFSAEMDPGPAFMTTLVNKIPEIEPLWLSQKVNISFRISDRVKFGMKPDVICSLNEDIPWDPIVGIEKLRHMIENGLIADNFYAHKEILINPLAYDLFIKGMKVNSKFLFIIKTDNPNMHLSTWVKTIGNDSSFVFIKPDDAGQSFDFDGYDYVVNVGQDTLPLVDNIMSLKFPDEYCGVEDVLTIRPTKSKDILKTALPRSALNPDPTKEIKGVARFLHDNRNDALCLYPIRNEKHFHNLFSIAYPKYEKPKAFWIWISKSSELPFSIFASISSFMKHNHWAQPIVAVSTIPNCRRSRALQELGVEFVKISGEFDKISNIRHVSDFIRLDLLYKFGGMYFDHDTITIGSFYDIYAESKRSLTFSTSGKEFEFSIGCLVCPKSGNKFIEYMIGNFKKYKDVGYNLTSIIEPTERYKSLCDRRSLLSKVDSDLLSSVKEVSHKFFYPFFWNYAEGVYRRKTISESLYDSTIQIHFYGAIFGEEMSKIDEYNWMYEDSAYADAYRLAMTGEPEAPYVKRFRIKSNG